MIDFEEIRSILEHDPREILDTKPKKVRKIWFGFLTQMIQDAITQFPKSVWLRILSSFIQRTKIKNEFKAIFDLMSIDDQVELSM